MLRKAGHEPFGLDIVPGAATDFVGSVADRALVDRLFAEHDFGGIIHAGALHQPDMVRFPRQAFVDANITGTLNLLEAAVAHEISSFVFTSTTSLMITQAIRDDVHDSAVWLDETSGPLVPRNIYGVTKRAAEELCRLTHADHALPVVILRTARFFPGKDMHEQLSGDNLKANEFLHRRLTVEDCARAHIVALEKAPQIGFGLYIVSAPPPFTRETVAALKADAQSVIAELFPEAASLYAARGWSLPPHIGRVYDPGAIERDLGFRCQTDFSAVLDCLREGAALPFVHDPLYVPPPIKLRTRRANAREVRNDTPQDKQV